MKQLTKLLQNTTVLERANDQDKFITAIYFDSRKVERDSVFVAIKGLQADGHRYIDKAIAKGATAIVCEILPTHLVENVTYIKVKSAAEALGQMAGNYYDYPSKALRLVGITGTNGKTTTVTLLYRLFTAMGYKVGLLSTVENKIANQTIPSLYTTPDAVSINALLAKMVAAKCDFAFMEVSSHAIEQRRIAGLTFTGGIFSNISHDHLDYHKTFKAYIHAKKRFFDDLPKGAFALTNLDDRRGLVMIQNTKATKRTYSIRKMADFKGKIIENTVIGLELNFNGRIFHSRLIGEFNAYNLLAVYGTAILLEQEELEVLTALSELQSAEGRFDYITAENGGKIGIVDYAHTPDALEKVLATINQLRKGANQIICVVGCGGDRDTKKRPIMAKVACDYSDQIILTSDNPRTESPETIIHQMEKGIPPYATNKVLSITNRRQAIKTACRLANKKDIILVAGKGHEKYQEINGVKYPFDDKAVLKEYL